MPGNQLTIIEAAELVLEANKKAREHGVGSWIYLIETARKFDINIIVKYADFIGRPTPESILKTRRDVMNKKNKFSEDYVPEPGVTFEPKEDK